MHMGEIINFISKRISIHLLRGIDTTAIICNDKDHSISLSLSDAKSLAIEMYRFYFNLF